MKVEQDQSISEARRQQEAKLLGPEGQVAHNEVEKAIEALKRFQPGYGLTNPQKVTSAEKNYRVNTDEVSAFQNAVNKWTDASAKGLLSNEYAKGVSKYLDAVHTRLITNKHQDVGFFGMGTQDAAKADAAKVETAYGHVLNRPKNPTDYILQLHSGETHDAIGRARTVSLLRHLSLYSRRNGGAMPTVDQINIWDAKIGKALLEQQKARTLQKMLGHPPI